MVAEEIPFSVRCDAEAAGESPMYVTGLKLRADDNSLACRTGALQGCVRMR